MAGTGLVGREDVLAQLGRVVEEAAKGRGGLVLLTGEGGIGKSAVVEAAADAAAGQGARVAWGWGWQGEGTPPYWPWVQVFRSLLADARELRRLAAATRSLARLMPELPGSGEPPFVGERSSADAGLAAGDELDAAARFRLLDELTTVLLAAGERSLVVVLENLQWADGPSLQLLDFPARRLTTSRALVLGTWRDLDQAPGDPRGPLLASLVARSTLVPLGPLDEDGVGRLVAGIRRRTGGNPFFVEQVTRLLGTRAAEPAGIPVGVREAVERRLDRLSPACAELVTAAAVAGPECDAALLARVAGEPAATVRDLLGEAVRARVLDGPDEPLRPYRFAHDLFRESLLAGLDPPALASLHLRVGQALETERDAGVPVTAAQLADHFARAGPGATEAAVRYAALAAADATQRLAHEEAARHWARALEALDAAAAPDATRRTGLLLELAAARRRAGDLAGSRLACLQAAELARRAADRTGWPGPRSASTPSAPGAGPRPSRSWCRCWRRLPPPSATRTRPCGPGCWPAWPGSWPGTAPTWPGRPGWPTRPWRPPARPATWPPSAPAWSPGTTPAGGRTTRPTGWPWPTGSPGWPATRTRSCWPRPGCWPRPTGSSWPTRGSSASWPSSCAWLPTWGSRGSAMPRWPAGRPRRCWPAGSARPSA